MSEPLEHEQAIFDAALGMQGAERLAYLQRVAARNPALCRRIEALLQAYETGTFIEHAAALSLRQNLVEPIPLREKAGDRIGRYKLLEQIGEGGCGVVYVAEQEEPVRRRVALKIIKLGMDTKAVIARFEAERQALALMDHPNIAKVFDAGATDTGRPYFVMELVRGLKITEYCDQAKLSISARLSLFIQVCQAIQHAHQKGVIHRDIKPSNILVTVNDGLAVPKVIDFGIAKATGGQHLTDKTIYTAFEQFIGTPAYMSPEQAVLTSVDIDTRSDIYALGVLLYEVLTGKTPFDSRELLAIGLDEMRRTIREKEPERPSTRLSTLPGEQLSTTAQRRSIDVSNLVGQLRGDLDWIVMKCLEKDRGRRYETANGLAADVQRHLQNEPVIACPPTRLYRFQKMVRRNRFAFGAASAVMLSLVAGLTTCAVLLAEERVALRRADEQAAIAKEVKDFLQQDLLKQADVLNQAETGFEQDPNLTVKEALRRASDRIGQRFAIRPLVEAEIRQTIGNAFEGLGEPNSAIPHFERALVLYTQVLGPQDRRTLAVMYWLGTAHEDASHAEQAATLWAKALKLQEKALGPDDPDTLRTATQVARRTTWSWKPDDVQAAISLYKKTMNLQTLRLGPDHPDTLETMQWLAYTYTQIGDHAQALQLEEQILDRWRRRFGSGHPATVSQMVSLADDYLLINRPTEAIKLLEEALGYCKDSFAPTTPRTTTSIEIKFFLVEAYRDAGRLDDERRIQRDILTRALEASPQNRDQLWWRVRVFAWLGHWKEAAADTLRLIALNDDDIWAWYQLGPALVEAGDLEAYRENCAKALRRFQSPSDPCAALSVAANCLILPSSGADPKAVARLADFAATDSPNHWAWGLCQVCRALSDYRQGFFDKAAEHAELALVPQAEPGPTNRVVNLRVRAKAVLAMSCWRLGRKEAARTALAESIQTADEVKHGRQGIRLGGSWPDWLYAQAVLREAITLIGGDSAPK